MILSLRVCSAVVSIMTLMSRISAYFSSGMGKKPNKLLMIPAIIYESENVDQAGPGAVMLVLGCVTRL